MAGPAQRAIALLIEMAEQGEIDPWDVKVIEVIDRFLVELRLNDLSGYFTHLQDAPTQEFPAQEFPTQEPLARTVHPLEPGVSSGADSILIQDTQASSASLHRNRNPSRYEADLSESGQAFLYASMLVLFKADTLIRDASQDQADPDALELPYDDLGVVVPLPTNLERRLMRRAVARPPEQRRVTLQELIEQLELMALAMEAERSPRPKHRTPKPFSQRQAVRAISQLAHQENLGEVAASLGSFIETHWDDFPLDEEAWLNFDELVYLWHRSPSNIFTSEVDRVGVFWALLFLSAQGKVELLQAEFYGGLQLRVVPMAIELGLEANALASAS